MSVYFIQGRESSRIKIGYAGDVKSRFSDIGVGSPEPLDLLTWIDGGPEEEAALHAQFSHLNIRGEWFEFGDDLRAFIESLPRQVSSRAPAVAKAMVTVRLRGHLLDRLSAATDRSKDPYAPTKTQIFERAVVLALEELGARDAGGAEVG